MAEDSGDAPQNPSPGGGRKPTLTEAKLQMAIAILMKGAFRATAAKAMGVTPRTFQRWMALGKRYPDGLYGRLARVVPLAEAEFEVQAVAQIFEAGKDDAKFYCWMLERKFPGRWGKYRGELGELKRRIVQLERLLGETPDSQSDPTSGSD